MRHRSSSAQSRSRFFLLPFLCGDARGGDSSVTGPRETSLPAVEGRMSFLHGYEGSLHAGRHLAFDIDEPLDGHAITLCGGRACPNLHGLRDGGRAKKLHFVRRGYGSRWRIHSIPPHQSIGSGPVSVAVEEGREDSAVHESCEGNVLRLRLPLRDDLVTDGEAPYSQTLWVLGPAAEAETVGRVPLLQTLHVSPPRSK